MLNKLAVSLMLASAHGLALWTPTSASRTVQSKTADFSGARAATPEGGALCDSPRVRLHMQAANEASEATAESDTTSVTDWLNDQSLTVLSHRAAPLLVAAQ